MFASFSHFWSLNLSDLKPMVCKTYPFSLFNISMDNGSYIYIYTYVNIYIPAKPNTYKLLRIPRKSNIFLQLQKFLRFDKSLRELGLDT